MGIDIPVTRVSNVMVARSVGVQDSLVASFVLKFPRGVVWYCLYIGIGIGIGLDLIVMKKLVVSWCINLHIQE